MTSPGDSSMTDSHSRAASPFLSVEWCSTLLLLLHTDCRRNATALNVEVAFRLVGRDRATLFRLRKGQPSSLAGGVTTFGSEEPASKSCGVSEPRESAGETFDVFSLLRLRGSPAPPECSLSSSFLSSLTLGAAELL